MFKSLKMKPKCKILSFEKRASHKSALYEGTNSYMDVDYVRYLHALAIWYIDKYLFSSGEITFKLFKLFSFF